MGGEGRKVMLLVLLLPLLPLLLIAKPMRRSPAFAPVVRLTATSHAHDTPETDKIFDRINDDTTNPASHPHGRQDLWYHMQ